MNESQARQIDLRAEAADRIVRAHMTGVAPEDDATLVAWRRADSAHEAAFLEAAGTWEATEDLGQHPQFERLMGAPTLRERWVAWREQAGEGVSAVMRPPRLAFAGVCMAVISIAGFNLIGRPAAPQYRTEIAQIRNLDLEDGSRITLGAHSALDVEFQPEQRRVKLASGEAFFSVAPNRDRPFIVEAGDTRIRVVGTKFNVNYEGGRVRVTVLEGVVEVMRADGTTELVTKGSGQGAIRITAGQQAVDAPNLSQPTREAVMSADPGGWREGRLSYQDAPLAEIIADANRYRTREIRLASPTLGRERLTTSFKTDQIDDLLEQLPDTMPVQVQRNADGTVDLRAR